MIRKHVANKANNFAIEKKINIKKKRKEKAKRKKKKTKKFALHYIHEISWL